MRPATQLVRAAGAVLALGVVTACGASDAASPLAAPAATGTVVAPPAAPPAAGAQTPQGPPVVAATQGRVSIFDGLPTQPVPQAQRDRGEIVELVATPDGQIGTYVADGSGRSMYRFDEDTSEPPTSTCAGDCAQTWPPLLVKATGSVYVAGLDASTVGYVERADGTCQITIGGWPVYVFAKDQQPGDLKGQGVGGTWFAVTPSGGKTAAQPAGNAGPASSSGY